MATTAQIQLALQRAQAAGNAQDVAALQQALTQSQQTASAPQRAQTAARGPWDNYAPTRRYIVTSPEGKQYEVTAPASASQADVMAYAQRQAAQSAQGGPWTNYARTAAPNPFDQFDQPAQGPNREQLSQAFYAAKQAGNEDDARQIIGYIQKNGMTLAPMNDAEREAAFQKQNAENVAAMSPWQTALAGAGKSVVDTGRGIAQLLGMRSQDDIDSARSIDAALMNTTAGKVGDFAGQAAQMAIPVGDAGKVLSFAGKAAPYVGAAIRAGTFAGVQPVEQGQSRAGNASIAAILGAGGRAISPALGSLARKAAPSLSMAKQAAIDTAERYGIPLHLSQVTDSRPLQTLASVTKYLPFSGNTAARNAQQTAFNRALSRQVGEDAPSLSDEVLANAAKRIGQGYDDLFSRNTVRLTPQDARKLTSIINTATKLGGNDAGRLVGNHVDEIIGALDQNGSMPGRLYQSLRTDQLLPSERNAAPAAGHYLRQARKVLEGAANRSMQGDDAQALAKLNDQYKSLRILQKAVNNRAAGAGGDVAPGNLWSLVNGKFGSTQAMRELAQLGQTVLKDPIPDSGTAARNLYTGALLGGGYFEPHAVAPMLVAGGIGATVGRVLNSPLAARTLPYAGQSVLGILSGAARPAGRLLPLMVTQPNNQPTVAGLLAPAQ